MENLKPDQLIKGEIYVNTVTEYNYNFLFVYDGDENNHHISGPYYLVFDYLDSLSFSFGNSVNKEDILRLATPEEKKILLDLIYKEDPNFQYIDSTQSQYEIY